MSQAIPRIAVAQMCSSRDVARNLACVEQYARTAHEHGAQLLALPENALLMPGEEAQKHRATEPMGQGAIQGAIAALAQAYGLWILVGSHPIVDEVDTPLLPYQRALLFDANGACAAHYDKIHLFDVEVSAHERYLESAATTAGQRVVCAETPCGVLGLSICFDLRFPALYQTLRQRGAQVLAIPAAFTRPTGQAHWLTLLRARAIENQCFVIAPAQVGKHDAGRETWGQSCIIDPMGVVLAQQGDGEGVIVADIDLNAQAQLRQRFALHAQVLR